MSITSDKNLKDNNLDTEKTVEIIKKIIPEEVNI